VDENPHFDGIACLGKLCSIIPSHIIWGERRDYMCDVDIILMNVANIVQVQTQLKPHIVMLLKRE